MKKELALYPQEHPVFKVKAFEFKHLVEIYELVMGRLQGNIIYWKSGINLTCNNNCNVKQMFGYFAMI